VLDTSLHAIHRPREPTLDHADALGEIAVVRRQLPQKVNVVWQDHGPKNLEQKKMFDLRNRRPKQRNALRRSEQRTALIRDPGQKEGSAGGIHSPVFGHAKMIIDFGGRCPPYDCGLRRGLSRDGWWCCAVK